MRRFNKYNFQKNSWALCTQDKKLSTGLAEALHVTLPLAQVLINRGIKTAAEGKNFLDPEPAQLFSPFIMKDMDAATLIIWQAVQGGSKIAVYGDYDVDGIGATALLYTLLHRLGADVSYYIPDRLGDGYGLNEHAVTCMVKEQISLLVTVDCGISDKEIVNFAREQGLQVVITDHHLPPAVLPPADAIVNPRQAECAYPFKDLCGTGVAFKLGQALMMQRDSVAFTVEGDPWFGMEEYLDLVTLATVADMVPLLGENRILVSHGLRRMAKAPRPGLATLCEVAAAGEKITTETISFLIAPRLNAAGRLGDASRALNLLMAESMEEAGPLAMELHEENKRRQQIEADILSEAMKLAEEMPENEGDFLLLAAPGWAQGVIGIVASRLLEQYERPVILISIAEGVGKGSGRSGEDFNITAALKECAPLLLAFGGHHCAAGLAVPGENIPKLRRALNILARQWRKEGKPGPSFYVDTLLIPQQISAELVQEIERLAPFGLGNPRPLFYGKKWLLEHKREVGRGQRHLQLGLSRDGCYFPAIFFDGKARLPEMQPLRELDVFFTLTLNAWRGQDTLQLELYGGNCSDEYIDGSFSLLDHRKVGRKLDYLRQLARGGEKSLVFVNTLSRMRKLEQQLGRDNNFFFTHQGQFSRDSMPLHNLVLYDLPLQVEKLKGLLQSIWTNKLKVHLIYGPEDWQDNLRLLTATIPSLCSLEQVVHALQEIAAAEGSASLNETLVRLKGKLSFSPTTSLLKKCLLIMKETACLKLDNGKIEFVPRFWEDYCTLLGTLSTADQYQWARQKWEETFYWQKYLLEAAGEEILNFFCEGAKDS